MGKQKQFAGFMILPVWALLIIFPVLSNGDNPPKDEQRLLHVEVFLEGLYHPGSEGLNRAHGFSADGPVPQYGNGVADMVTISLHATGDYSEHAWGDLLMYEVTVSLDTGGQAWVYLPDEVGGHPLEGNCWLSVRHRNHIETVYHVPLDLNDDGPFHCDFITGNAESNTALGNNQHYLGEIMRNNTLIHAWAMYAGDITGEGQVNVADRSLLYFKLSQGVRGYLPEDLNGDGMVTIADRSLLVKNLSKGISAKTPATK